MVHHFHDRDQTDFLQQKRESKKVDAIEKEERAVVWTQAQMMRLSEE
jgi:hypothetical protein